MLRGVLPEEARADIRAALDASGFAPPPGCRPETGGDSDARSDTLGNLPASLGIIVTLSVAVVVATFGSFRLTSAALLVAGLSMPSPAVFQHRFGIRAIIGVIGSIGVSINAATIIPTGHQGEPAAARGEPVAMAGVVLASSCHIVSTTIITFGGFLPLILAGGFRPPFAVAVAGGVLLSTMVSFYAAPPMFALAHARRNRAARDPARAAAA